MSDPLLGAILAVLAAASWAAGAVVARLGMRNMGPTTATFISLVSGFVVTLAIALVMDAGAIFAVSMGTIGMFAVLGAIQFPIGRFLSYNGIRLAGVAPASAILGSSPIVAASLALIFLDEELTIPVIMGILAVVAGLAIVVSERRE
jgi:uncharacterized membrane protein